MTTNLMDQQKELLDKWGKLTGTAFDSLREVSEINATLMAKLSEQQRAIIQACLEASTREGTLISGSKDYKELMAGQGALAAEYNEKFRSIVGRTTAILDECRNEFAAWVKKSVETPPTRPQTRGRRPG